MARVGALLTTEVGAVPGAMTAVARALALLERSCAVDRWPAALRRCAMAVPIAGPGGGASGLGRCASLVPPELRAALEPKLRALAP